MTSKSSKKTKTGKGRASAGATPGKTAAGGAVSDDILAAADDMPPAEPSERPPAAKPESAGHSAETGSEAFAAARDQVLEQAEKARREVARTVEAGIGRWLSAPLVATMFLTRLPIPAPKAGLAGAAAAFPLVGLLVGAAGGGMFWLATLLQLPPLAGGLLAVAAMAVLTGALHEDGFADMADGLAGKTPEDSIRIMRDSGTGAFGVLALILGTGLRVAALAAIAAPAIVGKITAGKAVITTPVEPLAVLFALMAAAALSRAVLPAIMYGLPAASATGQAARAGRPQAVDVGIGLVIAGLAVLFLLGFTDAIVAMAVGAGAALAVALIARYRLGGHTGDVLGAAQQTTEIAVLLAVASSL